MKRESDGKSKTRLVVIITVSILILIPLVCFAVYIGATVPDLSQAEMQALFDEAHRQIDEIPEQRLALGDDILAHMQTLPEFPNEVTGGWIPGEQEDPLSWETWYKSVETGDFVEKLLQLTREEPGAFSVEWDKIHDNEFPWMIPLQKTEYVLKQAFTQALSSPNANVDRIFKLMGIVDFLAHTVQHKNCGAGSRRGFSLRMNMCKALLPALPALPPELLKALGKHFEAKEKALPRARDMIALDNVMTAELGLRSDFYDLFKPDSIWLYQFQRFKVKTVSVMLKTHADMMAAMEKPDHEVFQALDAINKTMIEAVGSPLPNFLRAYAHLPSYFFIYHNMIVFVQSIHMKAACRGIRIAAALELYHRKNGAYPDKLAALVPDVMAELPNDPFTNKVFVYKRMDKDYLLYCAGANLIDDGGKSRREGRYLDTGSDLIIVQPPLK